MDLSSIYDYTLKTWGADQLRTYNQQILDAVNRIADNPNAIGSRPRDDIHKGAMFYPVGKHLIVYRATTDGIDIARILHQSMDHASQLKPTDWQLP